MARLLLVLVWCACVCACVRSADTDHGDLLEVLDSLAGQDEIPVIGGVTIKRSLNSSDVERVGREGGEVSMGEDRVLDRLQRFTKTHVLAVKVPEVVRTARELTKSMRKYRG